MKADVVIAGGGLAGLTCAVGLLGSGLRVVVVEREPVLGGRARSWPDETTGDPVPIGPHIFTSEYPNVLELLRRLGTADTIVWQDRTFVTMVDGERRVDVNMSPLPAPFHFVPSLLGDGTLPNRDWLSNVPITLYALALNEDDILALDAAAAPEVLRAFGVSRRYRERFWAFLSHSILNVPLELCSAGALLRVYRRMVGKRGYRVGFADRGLGDVFAPQSRAAIEAGGGTVLTGTAVARFSGDAERATGVDLSDGRHIEAPLCVAALTPDALLRAAPPEWKRPFPRLADLARWTPSPYRSVFLWFDRKLTTERFWARAYRPGDLNCDFYDYSNIYRGWGERPSLVASNVIYSGRVAHLADDQIVVQTVRELGEYLPAARTARLTHSAVHAVPMAVPAPLVGTESLRLDTATPIDGLVLAGDWLRTALPPSMESACFAGWRAAEHVLARAREPRKLATPHVELDPLAALLGHGARAVSRSEVLAWH
jgi:Flavin containing amine oxidoreductase